MQYERMFLTAPNLKTVLKTKIQAMIFLACASTVLINHADASCLLHCDYTGKKGLEFGDCVEEVNSQLMTRKLSQLLPQPPPPRSSHRLFERSVNDYEASKAMTMQRKWGGTLRELMKEVTAYIFRAEGGLCALEVILTPGYTNIQLDCFLQETC